jgi:hypothetical protein
VREFNFVNLVSLKSTVLAHKSASAVAAARRFVTAVLLPVSHTSSRKYISMWSIDA